MSHGKTEEQGESQRDAGGATALAYPLQHREKDRKQGNAFNLVRPAGENKRLAIDLSSRTGLLYSLHVLLLFLFIALHVHM